MIDFYKVENNILGSSKNIDYMPATDWINRTDWANTQVGGLVLAESHDDEVITFPEGTEILNRNLINKMFSPKKVDKRKYNNKIKYYRSNKISNNFSFTFNRINDVSRMFVTLPMRLDRNVEIKIDKSKYNNMEFYEK